MLVKNKRKSKIISASFFLFIVLIGSGVTAWKHVIASTLTDTTPPTVSITGPASSTTVSGSVDIEASTSDNVGVVGVQFLINGAKNTPELTSAPFGVFWDSTTVPDGVYKIQAVARDAAGNTATSSAVSITVNNSVSTGPAQVFSDDFTTYFSPAFSFSRPSAAWDYNASGAVTQFASNTPMIGSYPNATTTNEGLGIWSSRINQCLNSENPATQTSTTTKGTWIVSVVGTGSLAVNGAGVNGTSTSKAPFVFNIPATTAITFTPTGALSHIQCERQTTAAVTIADPTPPIVTGTTTVTRAQDTISAPLSKLGVGTTTATYIVKVFIPAFSNSLQTIFDQNDGTINNGYRLVIPLTHRPTCELISGGVVVASTFVTAAITPNAEHTIGCGFDQTGITIAVDGKTASTAQSNTATNYTQLTLGSSATATANLLDGYVSNIRAWNGRLTDLQLSALTNNYQIPTPAGGFVYMETMGQSLANGAHSTPVLTTTAPFPTCAYMLNDSWGTRGAGTTAYTSQQKTGGITGLVPALESSGPTPPYTDYGETNITSWMSQLCSNATGETYIGRGNGASGNTIGEIGPTMKPFTNAIGELTKISSIIQAKSGSIRVGAVAFIHGQTDAQQGNDANAYYSGELNIANTYNTMAKSVTKQSQDIPFFEMQVAQNALSNWNMSIAQSQYDIALSAASSSPLLRLCAPSYMFSINPLHQPHLINTSQDWQGEYLANCYGSELATHTPWKPLYPTSIAFKNGDRTKVEVALNVPVGSIVFDTTSLAQGAAPNYGLTFVDDCKDASIKNVSILDKNHLEAQLTAAPKCANPKLQNAYSGPKSAITSSGAWSNIRDTNPAVGHTTGFHLYDWLVVFSLPIN